MSGLIYSRGMLLALCIALFALIVSTGCGGNAPLPERGANGFALSVLPDSFEPGGHAEFELEVRELEDRVVVDVVAEDASGLRAVYLELAYDPARFTPQGVQATGLLEQGSQLPAGTSVLELGSARQPGVVIHGQVLPRLNELPGFTGSGVVATLTFAREPLPRTVSVAPGKDLSATTLSWSANGELSWGFASTGDYNQDGEVGVQDMTPLGANYLDSVAPAKFDESDARFVVDGDNNGAINIQDITPIGANLLNKVRQYYLYSSDSTDDFPESNMEAPKVSHFDEVDLADATGVAATERRMFSYTIGTPVDGAYYWVRPADGDSIGTPSNYVQYFAPNLSPSANLISDTQSGQIPLTVNFDASGSSDPDGTITKYQFDLDGDGVFELDNGTTPTAQHTYDTEGSYNVAVRVTDNQAATSHAQLTIDAVNQQPPTADLTADPLAGTAPLTVDFDASGSTDSDGTIVQYEWDMDGDASFEYDGGAVPTLSFIFTNAGIHTAGVRVTDSDGLTDVAIVIITVTPPIAGAPTADLQATPTSGAAPLDVFFDGSGSSDDLPGIIMLYRLDVESDGTFDYTSPFPLSQNHTYMSAGIYTATLEVTDDESNTDTDQVTITVTPPGPSGPVAILRADPRYGVAPMTVSFDASESSSDSPIVTYEFDWEGDGVYDQSGSDPNPKHDFDMPGVYDVKVRITDSENDQGTEIMLIYAMADASELPDDSLFALPSQSTGNAGENVGVEIYCNTTANPFQYATGIRLTMPPGNEYVSDTFNVGVFGGATDNPDGMWADMMPDDFLLPPDWLYQVSDIGGGQEALDLNITPLNGSDINNATGAICNFELQINTDTTFGFQDINGVPRTYYNDSNQTPDYFWGDISNSGFPGIDIP